MKEQGINNLAGGSQWESEKYPTQHSTISTACNCAESANVADVRKSGTRVGTQNSAGYSQGFLRKLERYRSRKAKTRPNVAVMPKPDPLSECRNGIDQAYGEVMIDGVAWFRVRGEKGWFTAYDCKECGKKFAASRRFVLRDRVKYCSRLCLNRANVKIPKNHPDQRGEKNHNWKGGFNPATYKRRFQAKFPEKVAAHRAFHAALKSGRIVRPDQCERCGVACKPHGHHDDYSKPLDVRWLCHKCHNAYHNMIQGKAYSFPEVTNAN